MFSLISFPAVSTKNSLGNLVKAADTDESDEHGLGCIPTPAETLPKWPKIDAKKLNEDLISKGITALPTQIDLSANLPPIGDQGRQGSCTAWATGYYYKTFQEGKEQAWSVTSTAHQFSPAFIYNQINGGRDYGSSIPDALQLLVNKGCDTLAVFPYNQYDYLTQPNPDQLQLALPFKAKSYANVCVGQGSCTDDTINTLKSWLANGDIFVIAMPVYSEFDYAQNNPNYVVPPHNLSDSPRGWHALAVVGYNDSLYYTDTYGTRHYGAFKIANSWGPSYGYNGYTNLSYDFFKVDVNEAWTMVDNPTPQGFTIGLSPTSQQVLQGHSVEYVISLGSLSGFNGNVSLSVSGLPDGITYSLSSASVVPPQNVTLTLNVGSSVSSGTYSFTVSATSATTTYNVTGKVNVNSSTGLLLHIKNQSGNPAVNAWVKLYSSGSSMYSYTDDTGSVYFSGASGTYTALISSYNDNFGLIKTVTAPGEYTFDTAETQHLTVITKKKDGTSLPAYIWLVPSNKSILEVGYSSGSISVDVTPGTYTIIVNGINDHYLLSLSEVTVDSSTSQILLDASTMPTGTITLTPHGFDYGYVYAWGSYCVWARGFLVDSQTVFTYSADTYSMRFEELVNAQDGSQWQYELSLTDANVIVTNGSSQSIDVGGNLSITTQPERSSYTLGEQVKLTNKVSDPYGNRLTWVYEYLPTATIDLTKPIEKDSVQPGFSASFGPLVKVVGPDNNVYYQSSSTGGFWSNSFTPTNWPEGTYTVNISLYTGPLQGVIYGSPASFTLDAFPPDAYEPDDTPANAKQIPTDGTIQTHNFDKAGDVDWIKFDAIEGKTYTIDTLNLGSNCNTVIELYAPDGTTFIDYNDDFDTLASRIDFECPQGKSGTYYVKVRNYNSNTFGANTNYDIRVYPALKISLSPEFCLRNTPTIVTVTVTQDGNPVPGATVKNTYDNSTQTTNSSGQAMFNVDASFSNARFDVTYGNYKRCYAYFFVLYSNSYGLVEVKPVDKNGYYLTNYELSTSIATNWWSYYNNTFRLPSPSGDALITLKKYYYYSNGTPYYMIKQTSVTGNSKTFVPFNAQIETVTLNLTGQLNGGPFSYAYVTVRNELFNYYEDYDVGYTDSSGSEVLYVTPGTYAAVLTQDNWGGTTPDVVLSATNINASADTTFTMSYTSSQLGTLNNHAYDWSNSEIREITHYIYGYLNNCRIIVGSTGEPALLSPGSYSFYSGYMYAYNSDHSERYYLQFGLGENFNVIAGYTYEMNIGGQLKMNVISDKSVYNPGDTVNIKVPIVDNYGHYLDYIYHWSSTSGGLSLDESKKQFDKVQGVGEIVNPLDKGIDNSSDFHRNQIFTKLAQPASGSDYPAIYLKVLDPNSNTIVDQSNLDVRSMRNYGYSFTLPVDAATGSYTASASIETGFYQGTVTGSKNFYVGTLSPLAITLTQPNGGESITAGSTYPIHFSIFGDTSNISYFVLYFTVDGGSSYERIDYVTFDPSQTSYTYSWSVPLRITSLAKLIVYARRSDATTLAYDVSDNFFNIIDPAHPVGFTITLTNPLNSSTITPDTDLTIAWTKSGTQPADLSYYALYVSYEGGRNGSWQRLGFASSSDTSFVWHVPSNVRSDYVNILVYPRNSSAGTVGQTLPVTFRIAPPSYNFSITVNNPSLNEILRANTIYTLNLTISNPPVNLDHYIYYLTMDNGASWELLSVDPSTLSFTVPYRISSQCMIMIVAVDSSNTPLQVQISPTFAIAP